MTIEINAFDCRDDEDPPSRPLIEGAGADEVEPKADLSVDTTHSHFCPECGDDWIHDDETCWNETGEGADAICPLCER